MDKAFWEAGAGQKAERSVGSGRIAQISSQFMR